MSRWRSLFLLNSFLLIGCQTGKGFLGLPLLSTQKFTSNQFYASVPLRDFNPNYYDKQSVTQIFLQIRGEGSQFRIDKWEISILKYTPQFRIQIEKFFPNSQLPQYNILTRICSGETQVRPGRTGLTITYTLERSRSGHGNHLESAWNQFQNSGFYQGTLSKQEVWEATVDGLWLSEEVEDTPMGHVVWRHKPGSLDFLHPITEFRSPLSLQASLYYDYRYNRLYKLEVEKIPNSRNLVYKEGNLGIHFLDGQMVLIQNPNE